MKIIGNKPVKQNGKVHIEQLIYVNIVTVIKLHIWRIF